MIIINKKKKTLLHLTCNEMCVLIFKDTCSMSAKILAIIIIILIIIVREIERIQKKRIQSITVKLSYYFVYIIIIIRDFYITLKYFFSVTLSPPLWRISPNCL